MKIRKLLKLNQSGFGHFDVIAGVAVIVMVGLVGIYISKHNDSHAAPLSSDTLTCPAGYTCYGGPTKINGSSISMVFYACRTTINLSKEGEPNEYTVTGYARASSAVSSGYWEEMTDFPTSATTGNNYRWALQNNKWSDNVVSSITHTVNINQLNFIALKGIYADSTPGGYAGVKYYNNLDVCPS